MENPSNQRLISLDAFRGFTIAGMIVVNDPGSWQHVYSPLLHAKWNGITPTDYVFPFFLFIVGVSIVLAYGRKEITDRKPYARKILLRSLKIYGVGLFLWIWGRFIFGNHALSFENIRFVGVLHRIALVFLASALLFLYTDWKTQLRIGIGLLVGYWILMAYVPLPDGTLPDLSGPMKNWAHYLDGILLPGYMWQKTWDPEGLLSTLPAIGTAITGIMMGRILISQQNVYEKLSWLFFWGTVMLTIGGIWDWFFPINKNLWTSSYVMYTSGLATLTLAAFMLISDVLGHTKWTFLGRVFGANSITAYALSSLLTVVFYRGLNEVFMKMMTGIGFAPKFASLIYALIYVGIIFVPVYYLYRKKIYIKL